MRSSDWRDMEVWCNDDGTYEVVEPKGIGCVGGCLLLGLMVLVVIQVILFGGEVWRLATT